MSSTQGTGPIVAVATGDIVASSELESPTRTRLPELLNGSFEEAKPDAQPGEAILFSMVGGDGWQCYVPEPRIALSLTLRFACLLIYHDIYTRFALALDEIEILKDDLNESAGPAFQRSGRAVEQFRKNERVRCLAPENSAPAIHLASEGVGEIMNLLLKEWTSAQAQAVGGMLQGYHHPDKRLTQADVAAGWKPRTITRQTVNRHLDRAHWPLVERTLDRYRRLTNVLTDHPSTQ